MGFIMRKIYFGSVEIMGFIGIVLWIAVTFLRGYAISDNSIYLFLRGIVPNLGAAWAATMFGKWIILYVFKQKITIRIYFYLCAGIFALALISETVHDLFLNSPFDFYDIIITAIAQILMFSIPIATKDKFLSVDNE